MTSFKRRRSLTVLTLTLLVATLMPMALPAFALPGITVTPTSGLTVTEAGGTAAFDVVLDELPTGNVTIGVSSSDDSEATVSHPSLTFTPADWDQPQTVTVTGVNDDIDDDNQPFTIVLAAATSTDVNYSGMNPTDVSGTNIDDDTAGISVMPISGLTTTEAGGSTDFAVVLTSEPTAAVGIAVTSSDTTEATASVATLTFDDTDWDIAQTVTVAGVNDDIDDGNQLFTIVLSAAASTDAKYDSLDPGDVSGTNTDDDTAGITVTPASELTTNEAGGTDTFTVVLDSEPKGTVVVDVSSDDESEATVDTALLTFTAGTWDSPRLVTVTGVNDPVDDGAVAFAITLQASSDQPDYIGLPDVVVSGTNADNDVTAPLPPASETFTDLDGLSQETLDAIDTLVALGITQGTSATTYSPTEPVTRWQMALFITRQLKVHAVTLPDPTHQGFTDLTGLTQETIDAISQIAALDVTTGTSETTYSPNGEVNRWQMALFMTRVLTAAGFDLPAGEGSQFADIGSLDPATQTAIRQLAELGIVFGTGDELFSPNQSVSRWQMALFIVRTLEAAGDLPA